MVDPTRDDPAYAALDLPAAHAWLWPLETVGARRRLGPKRVGGKAASLGRLIRDGFPVPRGWVLDARCFTQLVEERLPKGHDLGALIKLAGTKTGIDRAARARDRILHEPLPDDVRAAIDALWLAIAAEAPWGLAVRSSATCEDTEDTSMAGLATSVLGVRGGETIAAAIREVWASAFLPRAIAYMAHAGTRDVAMAVVLQVMVRAEAAGVLFTAPPPGLEGEHWRAGERLINATLGLGAPVVEGAVAADMVRIAAGGAIVATITAEKRRALVVGPAGLHEIAVPEARMRQPALGPEAVRALAAIADRLEEAGGGPFDVEFAVDEGVWILQVRPLRGGRLPEGGDADTVWSRANVGEALPGAATPLTWSVARAFSDRGFREAFAALGCKVPRGAHLVGNVVGRFYLNLTNFMQIAAQVPGLSPAALLGVSGGASPAAIARLEAQIAGVSKRGFVARLPLTAPRMLLRQAQLEREVESLEAEVDRSRRALGEMDLTLLPDDAIATTLKGAFQLLERTGTLMLHCASASLASHLALCKALEKVASRRASARSADQDLHSSETAGRSAKAIQHIAHTLASGVRDLESAAPGVALSRAAAMVRRDPIAVQRLLAGEVRALADLPEGPARDALARFLDAYGDRAVREAELATPRWREDPAPVIAMLTAALRGQGGADDAEHAMARARALADREMALLEARLSRVELFLVRALVDRTQRTTRLRERMRTWVTRVLGMLRAVALDIDRRLRRIDPSLDAGSVFFCTYEELITALSSGRADIGHVVRLRRAEHLRDAARPDPPPTFIGRPPPVTLPPVSGTRFVGLPASGGVVEGRARVLAPGTASLDAVRPGEVLVSRTTDVGLSPLFLVAAAVVTELGGPLSHASIVAREYGIPAVVNVAGATAAIRTGDRLRVDGDRGIVERIEDRSSLAPPPK